MFSTLSGLVDLRLPRAEGEEGRRCTICRVPETATLRHTHLEALDPLRTTRRLLAMEVSMTVPIPPTEVSELEASQMLLLVLMLDLYAATAPSVRR